jgi:hypothetical protein
MPASCAISASSWCSRSLQYVLWCVALDRSPPKLHTRGCAHSAARLLISTTHPLALDSRIDSERRALATPLVRVYARLLIRPSEKPLLVLRYISPLLDTTTLAIASLSSSATLRRWRGWVPKVEHGVSRPRSYSTRKRWRSASIFAEPLLAPPDSLGESHGRPSEIAHSLRRNLGMSSGVDRPLVSFLCPIVFFPLLKEHA